MDGWGSKRAWEESIAIWSKSKGYAVLSKDIGSLSAESGFKLEPSAAVKPLNFG